MADAALTFKTEEAEDAQALAKAVLAKVALCLKLATMHRISNAAMVAPIEGLLKAVNPLLDRGEPLQLQTIGDNFFLNRQIIKLDFSTYDSGQAFRALMKRLGANELSFSAPLTQPEVQDFLTTFQRHLQQKNPKEILKERIPKVGLRAIGAAQENAPTAEIDERQNVLRSLALLSMSIEQQLASLKAGKAPQLSKLRRAIHTLADAAVDHEALLVALTRFEAFAGKAHFHLTAVTALTLLMCRRLEVSKALLTEACIAAALHDAARADLPDLELEHAARRVPLRTILKLAAPGLTGDMLECLAVAHELTSPVDLKSPAGIGQLIAVPCSFDRLTSQKGARRGLLPDQALRIILDRAGTRFDGRVVRLFSLVIGLYPIGTLVRLTTGETAIVLEVPAEPSKFARPRLKVIRTSAGPADFILDLASPGETRSIQCSVDPAEEQVSVPQFLLA